jgi:hypothetical protein
MNDITIKERAIQVALTYVGKTEESNNDAGWLHVLMDEGGNPAHWQSREPYCISAALACFGQAYKEAGMPFPLFNGKPASADTQIFYDNAAKAGAVVETPQRGDIIIFRLGQTIHGHAGIVTEVLEAGVRTVEFNTSPTYGGSQHEGEGCFLKYRHFDLFQNDGSDTHPAHLWIRGYVRMPEPQAETTTEQPSTPTSPATEEHA